MGFSVGDRVEVIYNMGHLITMGKSGEIVSVLNYRRYAIYLDDDVGGYEDAGLNIPKGHGILCDDNDLKLIASVAVNNSVICVGSSFQNKLKMDRIMDNLRQNDNETKEINDFLDDNNISTKEALEALEWYFKK